MTDDRPEGVLTPDELDPDDDRLREIEEGRYVVSVDDEETSASSDGHEREADPGQRERLTAGDESVSKRRSDPASETADYDALESVPEGAYAVSVAAVIDGERHSFAEGSNDVSVTFEALLRWYAETVAPSVPPEEAVAVLLSNTDLGPSGNR